MSDNASQLLFEFHKGQAQFAYFQLGVAASAIAFAIHETTGLALADAPWPLGAAVLAWGMAFALGCFGLEARQDGIHTNALFLQIFGGLRPDSHEAAKVIEDAKATVSKDLGKPRVFFRWQRWSLFAGACFYVAGHLMQMATLPSKHPPTPKPSASMTHLIPPSGVKVLGHQGR
ncbi:hypothetical protein [Novosphingobium sp.]|uniref:hypothetical protein n=1 Tax=Novosphingobium sp. TaxID=1874826 RepID=UPI0025FEA9CE|nr:hypothetical protein [Novosphingobium sp.]